MWAVHSLQWGVYRVAFCGGTSNTTPFFSSLDEAVGLESLSHLCIYLGTAFSAHYFLYFEFLSFPFFTHLVDWQWFFLMHRWTYPSFIPRVSHVVYYLWPLSKFLIFMWGIVLVLVSFDGDRLMLYFLFIFLLIEYYEVCWLVVTLITLT